MSTRRNRFRRLDDRTGRLERAVNIINDGQMPSLRVHRREADEEHPLSRPFKIPVDRSTLLNIGPAGNTEGRQVKIYVGYTPSISNLSATRTTTAVMITSGGFTLTYTEG